MLLSAALERYARAGYHHAFELSGGRFLCIECGADAHPADVVVEGMVKVTDAAGGPAGVLYAVECLICGVKGTWHVAGDDPEAGVAIARLREGRPGPRSAGPAQ